MQMIINTWNFSKINKDCHLEQFGVETIPKQEPTLLNGP